MKRIGLARSPVDGVESGEKGVEYCANKNLSPPTLVAAVTLFY
jgi:hypothetical protein